MYLKNMPFLQHHAAFNTFLLIVTKKFKQKFISLTRGSNEEFYKRSIFYICIFSIFVQCIFNGILAFHFACFRLKWHFTMKRNKFQYVILTPVFGPTQPQKHWQKVTCRRGISNVASRFVL